MTLRPMKLCPTCGHNDKLRLLRDGCDISWVTCDLCGTQSRAANTMQGALENWQKEAEDER